MIKISRKQIRKENSSASLTKISLGLPDNTAIIQPLKIFRIPIVDGNKAFRRKYLRDSFRMSITADYRFF